MEVGHSILLPQSAYVPIRLSSGEHGVILDLVHHLRQLWVPDLLLEGLEAPDQCVVTVEIPPHQLLLLNPVTELREDDECENL